MNFFLNFLRRYYFIDDATKQNYGAIPLISLIVWMMAYALGYSPLPW